MKSNPRLGKICCVKAKAGEEITLATVSPSEILSQQIHSSVTQTSS